MSSGDTILGYFRDNIKRALIEECLESGDPDAFFTALYEVMSDMAEEVEQNAGEFPWDWDDIE